MPAKKKTQPITAPAKSQERKQTRQDNERDELAICEKLIRGCVGNTFTPFEEFFQSLLIHCEAKSRWPTPDEVQKLVDEYREEFENMSTYVANFIEATGIDPKKEYTDAA